MRAVLLGLCILCSVSAQNILYLGLNERCKNGTTPWTCKKGSSCEAIRSGTRRSEIKICGFSGREIIVCCPPEPPKVVSPVETLSIGGGSKPTTPRPKPSTEKPAPGRRAEEKCREYAALVFKWIESPVLIPGAGMKKIDTCAINTEKLIVGGKDANLNEFPHMALIGTSNKTGQQWFCGGSLISPRFILSAAHCNVSQKVGDAVARLGDLDIKDDRDKARPVDIKIVEVFDHPRYDHSKAYHDISLFKLERDAPLGPSIRPLCLHLKRSVDTRKAIASGWGYTSFDMGASTRLQQVPITLISDEKCRKIYEFERYQLPQGITSDTIMCAGDRGKDTCQGDSGGPLQITLKEPYCMYSQIGVTSFGVDCGTIYPGAYTRVSHYVPWIEDIVWP